MDKIRGAFWLLICFVNLCVPCYFNRIVVVKVTNNYKYIERQESIL